MTSALNGIEILHRQIKQIMVIIIEIAQILCDNDLHKAGEKEMDSSKLSYLVKQSNLRITFEPYWSNRDSLKDHSSH